MESDCEKEHCAEIVLNSHHDEPTVFEFNTNMIAWITVNVILVVFIICGNMLTIFAVRICRRLRAVVSNLFILSLAVSDMIVGLTLPYHMAFYLGSKLGQSHKLCLLRFYIVIFACCISIWNLVSIAVDRYIAIMYPLHYRRYMTRRVAVTIIITGWIVGTFVACIPVFWNHWHTAMECEFDQVLPAWYMAGIITPGFIVMWLCMFLVHLRIWKEANKQAKQMRKATCCHLRDGPSDWKSVQVVLLIMGSFTVCWLPYFVVACGQIFVSYDTSPALYKGALTLAMANSGVNPIIYAWKNTNFRTSFGLLLRCKSPNGCYTNEFSAREPYERQITDNLEQGAAIISNSGIVSNAPTLQDVRGGVISTALATCDAPEGNSRAPTELNAVQLFYCMEANRNRLPTLPMVGNESCLSPGILCSSCELCKLILSKRNKLGQHLRGALVPWKCGDYNHHIINAMKCTW